LIIDFALGRRVDEVGHASNNQQPRVVVRIASSLMYGAADAEGLHVDRDGIGVVRDDAALFVVFGVPLILSPATSARSVMTLGRS
jgi:hypothetical protein